MTNEALCKILCHNRCCLIQSIYELGATATFWGQASEVPNVQAEFVADDDIEALAWV